MSTIDLVFSVVNMLIQPSFYIHLRSDETKFSFVFDRCHLFYYIKDYHGASLPLWAELTERCFLSGSLHFTGQSRARSPSSYFTDLVINIPFFYPHLAT